MFDFKNFIDKFNQSEFIELFENAINSKLIHHKLKIKLVTQFNSEDDCNLLIYDRSTSVLILRYKVTYDYYCIKSLVDNIIFNDLHGDNKLNIYSKNFYQRI